MEINLVTMVALAMVLLISIFGVFQLRIYIEDVLKKERGIAKIVAIDHPNSPVKKDKYTTRDMNSAELFDFIMFFDREIKHNNKEAKRQVFYSAEGSSGYVICESLTHYENYKISLYFDALRCRYD